MNTLFQDLIIFELANNHQGCIKHAEYIIRKIGEAARKHKINAAVKFQYRDLDTLVHPDYKKRTDVNHIPRFYSTRISNEDFLRLVNFARNEKLVTMCTPFDEVSVTLCVEHGIDILKVASCGANDWPLLEEIVKTKKPVIISTGGKPLADIDKIYNFFTHRKADFALLHCVGIYPVQNKHAQLNFVERMRNRYPDICIGYSGHEDPSNTAISQIAIAKGATILERHVGHKTDTIPLNAYSTEIDEIDSWLEAIFIAKEICGQKEEKQIEEAEIKSLNQLSRGCYSTEPILKGETITRDKVFFAMPCIEDQTTSGQYLENMIASRDYDLNAPIFEMRPKDTIAEIRSIIHDIKGMLYEAKIVIGKEFELELSHHYGMEKFREFGATMISIINREYCKKIIIVLAGQKNPMHMHKSKEETFQVLTGELQLTVENEVLNINAGEIYTVKRGVRHAFLSHKGCIFEEISTTHLKNDSYYEDADITKTDVIKRKTILKNW